MGKIKPFLSFTSFVIVMSACVGFDIFCHVNFENIHTLYESYALIIIATSCIGLFIGALSPSLFVACVASVVSIALGTLIAGYIYASTASEIFFDNLGSLYWLGHQLLVAGLSGLIGYQLAALLSDFRKKRIETNETAQSSKLSIQGVRKEVSRVAWLWPIVEALIIFGAIFGHLLIMNNVIMEKKAGRQRLIMIFLERNAKNIYSLQKNSPTKAGIQRAELLSQLKSNDKQYLHSHPKEFPNAYRMFSIAIKENNRQQSGTPTH